MVKGARQREWPRHLSTHTHTHWTLPTTMSVLETPFYIHVSSVYQTHTCMQAPIPTLCISAKKTHNKGSRTRPIMSTLMPRSGIPVICSRATLSCDSSYLFRSDKNSGCYGNYSSHRLIIGKEEIDNFFCLNGDIWNLFLQKCLLSSPLFSYGFGPKSLNLIGYQGNKKE